MTKKRYRKFFIIVASFSLFLVLFTALNNTDLNKTNLDSAKLNETNLNNTLNDPILNDTTLNNTSNRNNQEDLLVGVLVKLFLIS
tara:strand:+ start:30 stop:284 length:255 start_codon:yes stop_codon:yes gene_type:complete